VSQLDPCVVLGIAPDATLDQARAAWRRLAKEVHPDLHGERSVAEQAELAARMTLVNRALAQIEAEHQASLSPDPAPDPAPAPARDGDVGWAPGSAATRPTTGAPERSVRDAGGLGQPGGFARANGPADPDSFSVGWLPAEAFEALFLAAYGLGDILEADEPYLLELYLTEPEPCFCRLTLAPEAGGSLVTVDVSPAAETLLPPDSAAVIEVLVAELNALVAG